MQIEHLQDSTYQTDFMKLYIQVLWRINELHEQSPSRESDSVSPSQEIPLIKEPKG
jgi:hypothetical protein